jgi:hypothetical protein
MAYLNKKDEELLNKLCKSVEDFIEEELNHISEAKVKMYFVTYLFGHTHDKGRALPPKVEQLIYNGWDALYDYIILGKEYD